MTRANIEYIRNMQDLETVSDHLSSNFFRPHMVRSFGRAIGQPHTATGRAGYIVVREVMRYSSGDTETRYAVWRYMVSEYTRESDGRLCDAMEWHRIPDEYGTAGAAHDRAEREAGYARLDSAHLTR